MMRLFRRKPKTGVEWMPCPTTGKSFRQAAILLADAAQMEISEFGCLCPICGAMHVYSFHGDKQANWIAS